MKESENEKLISKEENTISYINIACSNCGKSYVSDSTSQECLFCRVKIKLK